MNGGEGMPRMSYVGDSHCPRMPWSCSLITEVCSMLYMGVGWVEHYKHLSHGTLYLPDVNISLVGVVMTYISCLLLLYSQHSRIWVVITCIDDGKSVWIYESIVGEGHLHILCISFIHPMVLAHNNMLHTKTYRPWNFQQSLIVSITVKLSPSLLQCTTNACYCNYIVHAHVIL